MEHYKIIYLQYSILSPINTKNALISTRGKTKALTATLFHYIDNFAISNVIIPNSAAKIIVTLIKKASRPLALPPKTASAPPEIEPPIPELLLDCKTTDAISAIQTTASNIINAWIKITHLLK